MNMVSYNVRCRVPGETKARLWLEWLQSEHIAAVIEAGASNAEVVRFDNDGKPGILFEIRYGFTDRAALELYLINHAPGLRAEGIEKFPPEDGFLYERTIGEIVESQMKKDDSSNAA